jgi:hypothetical protein
MIFVTARLVDPAGIPVTRKDETIGEVFKEGEEAAQP